LPHANAPLLQWQAVHELHRILGLMAPLGSPMVLTTSLLASVACFFAEPAKARLSMRILL